MRSQGEAVLLREGRPDKRRIENVQGDEARRPKLALSEIGI